MFTAGFASIDVTPPLGMAMQGLQEAEGICSIHDPLYVRALAISDGSAEVLIIAADLLFFERKDVDGFKSMVGRTLGIPPEQILLNASHTHAGPRLTTWNYNGAPDADYLDQIAQSMVRAGAEAWNRRRPVIVTSGRGTTQMPMSRRKPSLDGRVTWAPHPAGAICDAVPFCVFTDLAGVVVSVLFSASCHPSMIYGPTVSADYPGVAVRKLNEHFGTDGAIFLQGAAGETKPRQLAVGTTGWRHGDWDDVEAAGSEVAESVVSVGGDRTFEVAPDIRASLIDVPWALEKPPGASAFHGIAADDAASPERRRWALDMLDRIAAHTLPSEVLIRVHAVQLGQNVRLIGTECELVAPLGLRIIERYEGVTFPLSFTNGCQVYLPSTQMLSEGGYEVDCYWEYHYPSPIAPGVETTLDRALDALRLDPTRPSA